MANSTECPRAEKWIGGCRWAGRYDENDPPMPEKLPVLMSGDVKNLCRTRRYVRDVCTRCGRTIEREGGK